MNFLFWNIRKNKAILPYLQDICIEKDIDILVLAESPFTTDDLAYKLSHKGCVYTSPMSYVGKHTKTQVIIKSNLNDKVITHNDEEHRWAAWKISSTDSKIKEINLVTVHFFEKINHTNSAQLSKIHQFKIFIDDIESIEGSTKNTIVLGDFNMNPFDEAMVSHTGLNSVMERTIAKKISRVVDKIKYYYFYNPMWAFFGDLGKGNTSGTFYHNKGVFNYHWHILDQFLLRPTLIDPLNNDTIDIITEINTKSLLRKNTIDTNKSDHLPIFFTLNI